MPMYNPPHPGEVIKEEILKPLGLSIAKTAQHLGVKQDSESWLKQRAKQTNLYNNYICEIIRK